MNCNKFIPESCNGYRGWALQAASDSWGKIQVIHRYFLAVILIVIFCSSCVSDEEFRYTYDQVNALKRSTSDMENAFNSKLETVHATQAAVSVEIESLKKDLRELAGRVEDNEHLIQHSIEKDLNKQDELQNEVSKLLELSEKIERLEKLVNYHHEYLNLETFDPNGDADDNEVSPQETDSEIAFPAGPAQKPDAETLYETGRAFYKNEEYDRALKSFRSFLEEFPGSELADNAYFWIGECFMALKEYENAILSYQEVIKKYPKGNKVPNAMRRQAVAWLEIGDKTSAKLLLNKVIKNYPDSPEAKIAENMLPSVK